MIEDNDCQLLFEASRLIKLKEKENHTMASTLQVTVKQKSSKGQDWLEGSYQLPSSTVTKLARKDGSVQFPNSATLKSTARRLATALGREVEFVEPAKKAAKKSVKKAATKAKAKKSVPASTPATTDGTASA